MRSHFLRYVGRCCVWTDIYNLILCSSIFYIVYIGYQGNAIEGSIGSATKIYKSVVEGNNLL
jgi:hypothetical protein